VIVAVSDLSVLVTWSLRRRVLPRQLGVLTFGETTITLRDRDGNRLIDAQGSEIRAAQTNRTMIELIGPDQVSRYVIGPDAQLARRGPAGELMKTYGAVAMPPRHPMLSESAYQRMVSTRSRRTGSAAVAQHILWQPLLLQLIWERHARPIPPQR
jgi:hypothetical protein